MSGLIHPSAVLDAEAMTLSDFLRSSRNSVPAYQRDYSWEEDELEQLWLDICATRENAFPGGVATTNPEGHFLGAIVRQQPSSHMQDPELIDGQQRITTLSILISVLYEFADGMADPHTRTNVTMQLLPLIADLSASGRQPRLELSREQSFYNQTVVQNVYQQLRSEYWSSLDLDKRPVALRVKYATEFFHDHVSSLLSEAGPNRDQWLGQLVDVTTQLLVVLRLEVRDHRMAYKVFETLNFRGLELSQADLIKNDLIKMAEQQGTKSEVAKAWDELTQELERVDQINLVEFLQFHFSSKYEDVRASDLFETVIEHLRSAGITAQNYAADLVAEAKRVVRLIEGDSAWSDATNDALSEIRDILRLKYAYPLLMAAAARYTQSPTDLERWTQRTRDFCFRYYTISKNPLGAFTRTTTGAARALRDPATSDASVITSLQQVSQDAVFIERFAKSTVSTNKLGFYIIRKIEDFVSHGSGKTFDQGPQQHLEHIMPRNPGQGWSHVTQNPNYGSYVNRIGNLLGLEKDINVFIRNEELPFKITNPDEKDYSHSKFDLPGQVSSYLDTHGLWDFDSIERRQRDLAQTYATRVWPLT